MDSINEIKNLIAQNKDVPYNLIYNYIEEFIDTYKLNDSCKNIIVSNKYGYNDNNLTLYVAPDFFSNYQIKLLNKASSNNLKILFELHMINHELTHIIQESYLKNNLYTDKVFEEELNKSIAICDIDVNFLTSKYYNKYHDYFLFEANANIAAIIKNNEFLSDISILDIELYNQYIAKKIINSYYKNICPIILSDKICTEIANIIKKINPNFKIKVPRNNPYKYMKDTLIQNLEQGYPISNKDYNYISSVASGKIKVKKLFN